MDVGEDGVPGVPQLLVVRIDQHLPPQLHVLLDPPTSLMELPSDVSVLSLRERHRGFT